MPQPHYDAATRAAGNVDDTTVSLTTQLAHPTRLRLLFAVHAAPEATVSELAAATGITPNNATKALTALAAAGLVTPTRRGRHQHWHLTDPNAHTVLHHLGAPHSPLHPPH